MIGQVRRPEMGDQARMPFTNAVIHEVQRFADITPFGVPHMTSRDVEIQGFLIPKVGVGPSYPACPLQGVEETPMPSCPGSQQQGQDPPGL